MDADLQDPPELVLDMVARWKEGYKVVYARRTARAGESGFKLLTARYFYRFLDRLSSVTIPHDVGDFRLVDRQVVEAFRAMPEQDRFVRGMFAWLGFSQTAVDYQRPPRAAGETKYPLWRMARLAANAIVGFSDAPLRLAIWIGLIVSAAAFVYTLYVVVAWYVGHHLVEGWASTIVVLSFLSGINMILTGIVGLYVGRIHSEVKRRPLYVIDVARGFEQPVAVNELPVAEPAPRQASG
jgi:dolichol-phosphate mannosyltransferase